MSMHTTEEWALHSSHNMSQAKAAQSGARGQIDTSKKSHETTVSNNLTMYDALHSSMAQKVKNSYRLIEKLQKRAESLEVSMQKTKVAQGHTEQALKDKEMPLQLCCWRLEQREKRPLREQVRDAVEVALEEEKGALVDTQRRLGEAIRRLKAMTQELQQSLDDVRHDVEQKMQALTVDEMCLRSTERSMHAVVERTPPPASARSGRSPNSMKLSRHQVALQESNKNEVVRQQECERMNKAAAQREEAAKVLREESAKLIMRCAQFQAETLARSEKRMQERVQDTQQMRRRLDQEVRFTQAEIDKTKNTMSETRYQIKALEEPIDLTSSCASWRKQRSSKEHITDPVSTALQQHRITVLEMQQELVGHHQHEKSHLKELQERRERLKEDLRDKTASLHIDLNCLTHEAVRLNGKASAALSDTRLCRALKVDRAFVPGAVASARG